MTAVTEPAPAVTPGAAPAGPARPGAWLLGMLRRPEPAVDAGATSWGTDPRAPAGSETEADRGRRYAREAVGRILWTLERMPQGDRNNTAWKLAARLAELINAPWSSLVGSEVATAYMAACEVASAAAGGGAAAFPAREAMECLTKGIRHVNGRAAVLPDPTHLGEWTDWGLPPDAVDFSVGATAAITSTMPGAAPVKAAPPVTGPTLAEPPGGDPFADPGAVGNGPGRSATGASGTAQPPAATPADGGLRPMDPRELAIAKAIEWLDIKDEAARRRAARDAPVVDFGQLFLDDNGLAALPEPEPLIDGWLYRNTLARVWGPSGHKKTFITLSMAAAISTGQAWHSKSVKRARVAYVVAEGAEGMAKRAQAWCLRHDVESTGVAWLPMPVQTTGPLWDRFIEAAAARGFDLIVFDTQARITEGVNENDNSEMGLVVAALDRLRLATGACVMLVHHVGADELATRARGATAVKGAMHTEISVVQARGLVKVTNLKQKDEANADALTLVTIASGRSIVLATEAESRIGPDGLADPPVAGMTPRERDAVNMARMMVEEWAGTPGATKAEVLAAFRALPANAGITRGNEVGGRRAWSMLERLGRLGRNTAPGAGQRFRFLELDGLPYLTANPSRLSDETGWEVFKAPIPDKATTGSDTPEQKRKEIAKRRASGGASMIN